MNSGTLPPPPSDTGALVWGGTLTLDLGSTIGWAYGQLNWIAPWTGYLVTPQIGGQAVRFQALDNELCDMIERWRPERIMMESALPPQSQSSTASAELLYGMRAIVTLRAYGYSIPLSAVSADLVRNEMMGFCRMPGHKPGAIKDAVLAWCRHKKHWKITNHNAADAAMIWAWLQRRMTSARQLPLSPELVRFGG